jgi:hypothetical protein
MTATDYLKDEYNIDKPVKIWYGDFNFNSYDINSLEDCPEIVIGDFMINSFITKKLISLKGCPKEVYGDFIINFITEDKSFNKRDVEKLCKVSGEIFIFYVGD